MEMFESGWESDLSCRALRKWSVDPQAEDGGILGVGCWKRRLALAEVEKARSFKHYFE